MASRKATTEEAAQLQALSAFLRIRYSTLTDAFVALDVSNKHQITAKHFSTGLRKLGFAGADSDSIFLAIDKDGLGSVSLPMFLAALDPDTPDGTPGTYAPTTILSSPVATSSARPHRTPPGVARQSSGPPRGPALSPQAAPGGGPRKVGAASSTDFAHYTGAAGRGARIPVRSHSSDAVARRPATLTALSPSASAVNWSSTARGPLRHTVGERVVSQSPAGGGGCREPVMLHSPQLAAGTPRSLSRRADGSPGAPVIRTASGGGPGSYVEVLTAGGPYTEVLPAGGSLNLHQIVQPGSTRISPRPSVREAFSPLPVMGSSVPAPNQPITHDYRAMMEQVGNLKAQLAMECTERQIDCRALRVTMDDNMRQLRREAGEKARDEVQAAVDAIRSTLRRDMEETVDKTIANLHFKMDALSSQLRATAEDAEDGRRSLENQVMERCDRLNELLSSASEQSESFEQDIADLKGRLTLVEAVKVDASRSQPVPEGATSDFELAKDFEEFKRASERRLADMEAEIERSLGFNVLVEGRIASLQESLSITLAERLPQTSPEVATPGKPLDTLEEIPLDRIETLERQVEALQAENRSSVSSPRRAEDKRSEVLALAEQAQATSLRLEEALSSLKAQLPTAERGDICTMPEVETVLQEHVKELRSELHDLKLQQAEATKEDSMHRAASKDQIGDVVMTLDRRLQAAESDIARCVADSREVSSTIKELETLLDSSVTDMRAELVKLSISVEEKAASPADEGEAVSELERRLQVSEQNIAQCTKLLEESREAMDTSQKESSAQPPSVTLQEVEALLEASMGNLSSEVQRLGKEDSLLEVGLDTLRVEIEKIGKKEKVLEDSLESLRGELNKSANQEQNNSQDLTGMVDIETVNALDRRVQAGEHHLTEAVKEWRLTVTAIEEKLCLTIDKHLQRQEHMLREGGFLATTSVACDSAVEWYRQWAQAAMPCLAALAKPTARNRSRGNGRKRPPPTSPPKVGGEQTPASESPSSRQPAESHDALSLNGPSKRASRLASADLQPAMENSDQVSEGPLDSHLLSVISTLRAEVRRLREEQGIADGGSSGAATPSGASSTAPSFPSSKVLPTLGPLQVRGIGEDGTAVKFRSDLFLQGSPGGLTSLASSIHSGPLPSYSEFEELSQRTAAQGTAEV
mmetsp:Transcript_75889/g.180335  ORF Transcript_75889/g.180335 Transcript_75889/m.180335 type:complete len:1159 (-) Transcript_75889:58-3534(-)